MLDFLKTIRSGLQDCAVMISDSKEKDAMFALGCLIESLRNEINKQEGIG